MDRRVERVQDELHFTRENAHPSLLGRIPCVVQLPFQQLLDKTLGDRSLYNIALAEFGADWLSDLLPGREPDVVMGTGVEGMVQVLQPSVWQARAGKRLENPDFAPFRDPKGRFDVLSCIPLVCIANETRAAGRPFPRRFSDLLDPVYEKALVYPDDGALLNSIFLLYVEKAGGEQGLLQFRKNCILGAHPSQMIRPGGLQATPFLMLMPWVFARIKSQQRGCRLIWFEDGAPGIPLVVSARDTVRAEQILDFLCSRACADVFRKNGYFPSARTDYDNALPGPLSFLGWESIYRPDVNERIQRCRTRMEEAPCV
ncbi:MAG: ABC transporter substrate-binding protein [Lachnospiraceae bacterium]